MDQMRMKRREGFRGQKLIVLPKKIVTNILRTDPLTKQVFITDIGYYPKAEHHFVERPNGVSQHIFIYCTEGSGWLEVNKKKIIVSPSQFVTIPAYTPHRYGADTEKPWTIYWVHFKGDASAIIVDLILKNADRDKPCLSYSEDRIRLFEDICSNLEMGYHIDNLRYVNMIFSHFITSLIYEDKFNQEKSSGDTDIVDRVIRFMQNNITSPVRLEAMASVVNLSASHFSYIFKQKTGYSPIEYFNQLKIQRACQDLSFSVLTIKAVALNLGYDDQYYFSRIFTKHMGVSPNEYRKNVRMGHR